MKQSKLILEMPQMSGEDSRAMEKWNELVKEILSADKVKRGSAKRTSAKRVSKNRTVAKLKLRGGK